MWIKSFLTTCLLGVFLTLSAEKVDTLTVLKVAHTFFSNAENKDISGLKATPNAVHLSLIKSAKTNDLYYIVNNSTKGFVIISGNDQVQPILGFSNAGAYDPAKVPPALQDWLNWKQNELQHISNQHISGSDAVKSEWANLAGGNYTYTSATVMDPLLTTTWNQGVYYNDLCPSDANSDYSNKRVPVGCGATAMAQLMGYWKFPDKGNGSHSYTPTSHPEYGTLFANFGTTTYAWSQMPDFVASANNAVATLMYHLGVSVNMDYGPDGSSSFLSGSNSVFSAFSLYFRYKSSLSIKMKASYTETAWNDLIKAELNLRRPVIYRGADSKGQNGHMFVCDGYNADNYFHINWGWGGYYDGYFSFNSLTPDINDYTYQQYAIVAIEPAVSMLSTSVSSVDLGFSSGSSRSFNIASNVTWSVTCNASWLTMSKLSGSGCSQFTVTASSANTTGARRSATITFSASGVTSKTVTITQEAYSTALPNLYSIIPQGWDNKIVVSKTKSSFVSSTGLLDSDSLYIDINVANMSRYNSGPFYSKFYIDDAEKLSFYLDTLKSGYYSYYSDIRIGRLSAGTHTLKVVTDCKDMVFETNETDNTYTRTITVGADPKLGIDFSESSGLEVSPNPVSGILKVSNMGSSLKSITLQNMLGEICLRKDVREEYTELDLSGFAVGYYFLIIKTGDKTVGKKIIKI